MPCRKAVLQAWQHVLERVLMNECLPNRIFPAVICAVFESPIDALIGLHVPQDEAMNLVAASWRTLDSSCVIATIDGGRNVAALRTPEGRWAACNAFLDYRCPTERDAERQLQKLLKRGRRGCVGTLAAGQA